jgi:hypothetical protein
VREGIQDLEIIGNNLVAMADQFNDVELIIQIVNNLRQTTRISGHTSIDLEMTKNISRTKLKRLTEGDV